MNISQKLFHGKPLQSSWKGHALRVISLENRGGVEWLKLAIVLPFAGLREK
jgi:hypothetical protein